MSRAFPSEYRVIDHRRSWPCIAQIVTDVEMTGDADNFHLAARLTGESLMRDV